MKKLVFFISLSLLILVGCDKQPSKHNYERTIWTNPDVECCGINDPINNLEWITQIPYFDDYKTATFPYSNHILLFKNDITHENFIITNRKDKINLIVIYNCNGDIIDGGYYNYTNSNKINHIKNGYISELATSPAEPCYMCDEFFQTHTLIDTIAYYIVEP